MSKQKEDRLNQLQHLLPEGLVVDSAWLQEKGYSRALLAKYVRRGWLESPARGAYRRPGPPLKWQHVVISLQTLLDRPLIVGGRTALELQGYAHYLSPGGPVEIHLYSSEPPPGWVSKLPIKERLVFHRSGLFAEDPVQGGLRNLAWDLETGKAPGADPLHASLTRQPWGPWDWPLVLSTPERAILELLDEVPQRETFHQADVLMEGLVNLSPRRLEKLLADCRSIKVKRLFLWFADRHGHAWAARLDRSKVDLGKGKRMLVRGGHLDSKYLITVPEGLDAGTR